MRLRSFTALFCRINEYCSKSTKFTPHSSLFIAVNRTFTQWDLVGAVCLERKPVITQSLTPLEQKYLQYIEKLEVEKSYLSDHEKRHIEDKKLAQKLKTGTLEDMDLIAKQTAQDFEDACLEEYKKYSPAPRITDADINNDKHSIQRKLDSSLVLIVKEKLGNDFKWVLPQAIHQQGETLRQTAERALHQVAACQNKVRFMGNAPVGYYKYKYPRAVRGNGICGAKVFFFKAQLLSSQEELEITKSDTVCDYLWLTHSELEEVLVPVLCKTVESFLYPDTFVHEKDTPQSIDDEEHVSPSVANQC